jgi:hypothetical protein
MARLRALVGEAAAARGLRLEQDDLGGAILFTRVDLLHLDADALNDRLHAWAARDVAPIVPAASAFVTFRHARPASRDAASLDEQERWLDLEPTLRLELVQPRAHERDIAAFARLVPAFLAELDRAGRPAGWRRVDEGNAE